MSPDQEARLIARAGLGCAFAIIVLIALGAGMALAAARLMEI